MLFLTAMIGSLFVVSVLSLSMYLYMLTDSSSESVRNRAYVGLFLLAWLLCALLMFAQMHDIKH